MTGSREEPTLGQRIDERPTLRPGKLRDLKPRALAIRFAAGAATSILAGVASLIFGARPAGILLAFPAILAASLTLIEEQENSVDAREDARGAVVGGLALAVFAVVAALAFTGLPTGLALVLAAAAWLLAALVGYAVAWFR